MEKDALIYIAGHQGMVGSAILRKLRAQGYTNFLLKTSQELDLRNQSSVDTLFQIYEPQYVFLAAARVGGIGANHKYPGQFIYDNLLIQSHVIHASFESGVKKLLFFGSSCIYPKYASQPISESQLLAGPLEETNEAYAIAKIAGIKMCQAYKSQYGCNFVSVMPTNLFGPNDNYDLNTAHVLPSLLRKIYEAKQNNHPFVEVWGSGTPRREFLHVDDLADAAVFIMNEYDGREIVNVGSGEDITIEELAEMIKDIVGYEGSLTFNIQKPDGTPRKLLDNTKINSLGWKPSISLESGIRSVLTDYIYSSSKADAY